MNVLITGNMGYVGPVLVKQLRSEYPDWKLFGLDTGYFAHCLTNAQRLPECNVDVQYFVDVRSVDVDLLSGVDAIVHLAAISNDPMGNTFEDATLDINYLASVALARKAKSAGVKRLVFASSCSVYGCAEEGARSESSAVNPLTAYARSKVLTEQELAQLAGSDFTVTSLRFATACGMSSRLRLDLVLNDFVAAAVASRKITILSDGSPWRPLIHVEDMARALSWALTRDPVEGGDFVVVNAGSDSWNYQIRDLAAAVAQFVPGAEVSINKDGQPDNRSYRVDFSLFQSLAPRNQPRVDLKAAITGLREGLQGMGFKDADFRNSSLIRLKVICEFRNRGLLNQKLEWVGKPGAQRQREVLLHHVIV